MANGSANDIDISSTNSGTINTIYLVEESSSTQVKKETQDLEDEALFKSSSAVPYFLNLEHKIKETKDSYDDNHIDSIEETMTLDKEVKYSSTLPKFLNLEGKIKEIQDADGVYIDIKEEPMAADGDNALGSILESVKIKKETPDEIEPCYEMTKRDETPAMQFVLHNRDQEKNDKSIKQDIKNLTLPSDDISNKLTHERLPPTRRIRVNFSAFQPSSSVEKREQIFNNFIGEQISSALTSTDVLTSTKSPGSSKEGPFRCSICLKGFIHKSSLSRHHLIHTGEKPFSCDVCQKAFSVKTTLKEHMLTHTGERPFKCPECPQRFRSSSNMKDHGRRQHAGEKLLKCSVCSMKFFCPSELRVHQRVHTGEKPFKCSVCLRGFTTSSAQKKHEGIHTGEKPYECSVCPKRFRIYAGLKKHERIHTGEKPYKCSVCLKKFNCKSALKIHERIHTGEKPYKCSVCPKAFNQRISVRLHERTHS